MPAATYTIKHSPQAESASLIRGFTFPQAEKHSPQAEFASFIRGFTFPQAEFHFPQLQNRIISLNFNIYPLKLN